MNRNYNVNYTANDIAEFVINYHNDEKIEITNLRLQKILYLIQIYFYLNKNKFCFNDNFYQWEYGAVIPEIHHKYIFFGVGNIELNNKIYLDKKDEQDIKELINKFKKYRTSYLIQILYETKPCQNTIKNSIISKEKIIDYIENELK